MINYIIRKLFYGLLVLFGVITVVFVLFFYKPGDPARMMGGQHASPEAIKAIKKDLGLDLPFHQQYLLYLNDLLPLSIHNTQNEESHIYLEEGKYTYKELFSFSESKTLVLKTPYLRRSYQSKRLVSDIIAERLPETIILASTSIILATILGVILGVIAAISKGTFFDSTSLTFSVLGMSGPSYFIGLIIAYVFGYLFSETTILPLLPFLFLVGGLILGGILNNKFKREKLQRSFSFGALFRIGFQAFGIGVLVWLVGYFINGQLGMTIIPLTGQSFELPGTNLGMEGSLWEYDVYQGEYLALYNLILPSLALGIRPLAIVVQLTRSSMLDVMSQDYIRTATAKGVSKYKVILKHALKNAMNPVITAISGWFASLLAGAVFIEYIFSWRGLGWKVFEALQKDDLPVVMGAVLVIATMFVIINILVDIVYGILDPRVRMS